MLIAGFRLERVIGRGRHATVYEATQVSLDRRVALKVLDDRTLSDRVRRLAWPDHPGAVSLFGTGDSEHGPWLAMRLVNGATLETRRAPLDAVAAALDRAHAEGIVHGDVTARNVLVEGGRAYLSDFGLGAADATADDDRAALAALVRERAPRPWRRRAAVAAAAVAVAGVALGAVLASGGDGSGADDQPAPARAAGTQSIGSDLAPGAVESVGCDGQTPGGASPTCTISQRAIAGRSIVARADGMVRSWAVRGARGTLALQVLRRVGAGRFIVVAQSRAERIDGAAPHLARTGLAVAAGDRVAVEVYPAAAVGIRRAGARATVDRWFGPLLEPARAPERPAGTGYDVEVLLRVDVGSLPDEPPAQLRGRRAARAPAGRRVAERRVALGGDARTVAVVAVGDAVWLDLFDETRRLARVPAPGADARGRLVGFGGNVGTARVRWRNPDGGEVAAGFAVSADALR